MTIDPPLGVDFSTKIRFIFEFLNLCRETVYLNYFDKVDTFGIYCPNLVLMYLSINL